MFNFTFITMATLVTVGIMELFKLYLPDGTSPRVKGAVSLVLSIGIAVGGCFLMRLPAQDVYLNVAACVGLVQFSYDYLVKLLKRVITTIEYNLDCDALEFPLFAAKIENELNHLFPPECGEAEDAIEEDESKLKDAE